MKSASAIDRRFLLVIPYFTDYVVRSVMLCAGMASLKNNSRHFPKSKMAVGVVYCYCSPCPLGSFSGVSSKALNCFFVVLVFV